MGSLRIVPILLLLASPALAQTYGIGEAPTAAQLAQDITISPTGAGTSSGPRHRRGRRKVLFTQKNCIVCHGPAGAGGVTSAPNLLGNKGTGPGDDAWKRVSAAKGRRYTRYGAGCDDRVGLHPSRHASRE